MGTFYSKAESAAVDAVIAALQSGVIKLVGNVNTDKTEALAKSDAKYLATLLNELHEQLKANPGE